MGIHHSMNKDQVDEVLTEFEATTSAIKGIEHKISRVSSYVKTAKEQRETMSKQAEETTGLIDSMTNSMNTKTEDLIEYFTDTLDFFADLMETLENTIGDLQLMSAPRELQRELGPLLVPAVVLVMIITVSNCIFGFLLAGDEEAAGKITLDMLFGGVATDENDVTGEGINILKLFAVVHVVLIGIALFYLILEGGRRQVISRARRRDMKQTHLQQQQMEADAEREETEMTDEESEIAEEMEPDFAEENAFCAADLDEHRLSPEVGHQYSSNSGKRSNRQLVSSAGDSFPLSSEDALDYMTVERRESENDWEVQGFDQVSPVASSPAKDREDISARLHLRAPKKAITPPRALQPLQLPISEEHSTWDQVVSGEFSGRVLEEVHHIESEDSTSPRSPSQRPSPTARTSSKGTTYRKNSEFSDDEKSARGGTHKNMGLRMNKRSSRGSSGSRETSPPRRLSMSRVPKIQISSVLRRMQQQAVKVTKEGVPRPREGISAMDYESQDVHRSAGRLESASPENSSNTSPKSTRSMSPPLSKRIGDLGAIVDSKMHEMQKKVASSQHGVTRSEPGNARSATV